MPFEPAIQRQLLALSGNEPFPWCQPEPSSETKVEDLRQLLRRVNEWPTEVIDMILNDFRRDGLKFSTGTLAALKFYNRKFYKLILPILHEILVIDLCRFTGTQLSTLETMPFLHCVKHLYIYESSWSPRNRTADIRSALQRGLSALPYLQDVIIHLQCRGETYISSLLDVLKKLPDLKSLAIASSHTTSINADYFVRNEPRGGKGVHLNTKCERQDVQQDQTFFAALKRLSVTPCTACPSTRLTKSLMKALHTEVATRLLTSLSIWSIKLDMDIINLIILQSLSLRKLWLSCHVITDDAEKVSRGLVLPKLKVLGFSEIRSPYILPEIFQVLVKRAHSVFLRVVHTPVLEILGCGRLLQAPSIDYQAFGEQWLSTLPYLKEIWIQQDDVSDEYYANFDPYLMEEVKRVRCIFEETPTKVICYNEVDYQGHSEIVMYNF